MTPPAVRHYVYRCYDTDDRLLYIGCTHHVKSRMNAHRATSGSAIASRWLRVSMARYEVEGPYPNKQAGRDAEANAIYAEQPLFNRQGRGVPGFLVDARAVDYLMAHGHPDLAVETTCNCGANDEPDWVCYAHRTLQLADTG